MTLTPFLAAPLVVQLHAGAALLAALFGAVQLVRPKGGMVHRKIGFLWAVMMIGVAVSSFWIHEFRLIGPFSPIHLLSLLTIGAVITAIWAARAGQIDRHRRIMRQVYVLALVLTGAFTLLPGRLMHIVLFGG